MLTAKSSRHKNKSPMSRLKTQLVSNFMNLRVCLEGHPYQNFPLIPKSRTFLSANPGPGHDVTA